MNSPQLMPVSAVVYLMAIAAGIAIVAHELRELLR